MAVTVGFQDTRSMYITLENLLENPYVHQKSVNLGMISARYTKKMTRPFNWVAGLEGGYRDVQVKK